MNMTSGLDMTAMNAIVGLALLFAAGFFVAWAASPRLRSWIEKPAYSFQQNARRYDERLSCVDQRERKRL